MSIVTERAPNIIVPIVFLALGKGGTFVQALVCAAALTAREIL